MAADGANRSHCGKYVAHFVNQLKVGAVCLYACVFVPYFLLFVQHYNPMDDELAACSNFISLFIFAEF